MIFGKENCEQQARHIILSRRHVGIKQSLVSQGRATCYGRDIIPEIVCIANYSNLVIAGRQLSCIQNSE